MLDHIKGIGNKATGVDGLTSHMIKSQKLSRAFAEKLATFFTDALSKIQIPEYFATARIIPLSKTQLYDPNVGDVRCLYVLPQIFKLLELCIFTRLSSEMADKAPLHPAQMGLTPGKSTLHNVHKLLDHIEEAKQHALSERRRARNPQHRIQTFVVSTDFSKAFDCVNHERLLAKLFKRNISGCLLKFLAHFYDSSAGIINDITVKTKVGVPQGCVTSPFLWNVYVDDLCQTLAEEGLTPLLYADDACWIARGNMQLIKSIKLVENWCAPTTSPSTRPSPRS